MGSIPFFGGSSQPRDWTLVSSIAGRLLLSEPPGKLISQVLGLVAQSCLTLWDTMDYSPPGPSVHWILQASVLEWVDMSCSRGTSQHRDWTQISCIAGGFFTRNHQPGKPQNSGVSSLSLLQEIFPIQQSNRVSCIACKTQETSWSILIQEPCNFINSFWGATTNRETYFVQGIQNGIHFIPYGYHSLLRTKCTK